MSYITLNTPPQPKNYHFEFPEAPSTPPSETQLAKIKHQLGSKINPDYESGRKYTPVQKQRFYALTGAALCAIGAVGSAILSISIGLTCPLAFIAIPLVTFPLLGASIGLTIFGLIPRKDLDSPQGRMKAMQDIAFTSFEEIAKNHQYDQLIGFKLLDRVTTFTTPMDKTLFYFHFKELARNFELLDNWAKGQYSAIDYRWEQETLPIRSWYKDQEYLADNQRVIHNQQNMMMWQASNNYRLRHHGQRSAFIDTLAVGNAIGNTYENYHVERNLRHKAAILGEKTASWNQWRNGEIATVQEIYQNAMILLEKHFDELKII